MPLSDRRGPITRLLQLMRPGLYRGIQNVSTGDMLELAKLRFAARLGSDVEDSMSWCVLARKERGSGWRTIRRTNDSFLFAMLFP